MSVDSEVGEVLGSNYILKPIPKLQLKGFEARNINAYLVRSFDAEQKAA